jgi:hypothetical protein
MTHPRNPRFEQPNEPSGGAYQHQPHQAQGSAYGVPAPPPPRRRHPWVWLVAGAAALAIVGGGALIALAILGDGTDPVSELLAGEDSGVQACEAIRDAEQEAEQTQAQTADEIWTEEEYLVLREQFADSRHEAIRTNGVELMDIGWQMEQLGDDAGFEALPLLGSFMAAYAGLAGGCAEQGVTIPALQFDTPAPE